MSATGPVRVLWLIKGLGPGGAEQLLVSQGGATDRARVRPEVGYLLPWKDHRVAELEALDITVTCLQGPREADLRWAAGLRARLLRDPVDVVHSHSPYVASVVRGVAATLPRSVRPALVSTEHNRWPRYQAATRWANRLTHGRDDAHLAVSDDVRSTVARRSRDRVEVMVHGVDLDATRARRAERDAVRAELGIGPAQVVVGTVANFRAQKGYPDLLDAAAIALRDAPPGLDLRVVAVGQGPLEDETRARHRELGLGDRVVLTGYVPDAARVTAAFDIFTLASVHEGLPVALMDALVLGVPVVATAVGGIPQAVTEGVEGLLVPPRRPDLLAAGWLELAGDPVRRSAMAEAAMRAGARFDITHAARRLDDLYVSLALDRRRSGGAAPGAAASSRS